MLLKSRNRRVIVIFVCATFLLFVTVFHEQVSNCAWDIAFYLGNAWSEMCYRIWYPLLVKVSDSGEEMAAHLGSADAMFDLGRRYERGDMSVEMDLIAAKQWYLKAAQQGHLEAMYALGNFPYKPDHAEAVYWLQKAATRGHLESQCALGWRYAHGYGVQEDKAEAEKWYRMAAAQGNEEAKKALESLEHNESHFPESS